MAQPSGAAQRNRSSAAATDGRPWRAGREACPLDLRPPRIDGDSQG